MKHLGRFKGIFYVLDKTIKKNVIKDFKYYLDRNKKYQGFAIFSDYCINDKEKPNDIMSFSVAPMDRELYFRIKSSINENIPADIKKVSHISDKTITFLKDNVFFFSFNIKIEGAEYILGEAAREEKKQRLIRDFTNIRDILDDNDSFKSEVKKILSELNKKNFNLGLFEKIWLTASIASYLSILTLKYSKCRQIGWFSDRGGVMDSFKGIYAYLYRIHYNNLKKKEKIEYGPDNPIIGQYKNGEEFFYDDYIKIPDYLAGTLASYDYKNPNNELKEKHVDLIDKVFANNKHIVNLVLSFENKTIQAKRWEITLKE